MRALTHLWHIIVYIGHMSFIGICTGFDQSETRFVGIPKDYCLLKSMKVLLKIMMKNVSKWT